MSRRQAVRSWSLELVNEMYAYNDKLPMIVIDVPASDLSVLEVALRDAHSSLERLNALLILVCDVKSATTFRQPWWTGLTSFACRR